MFDSRCGHSAVSGVEQYPLAASSKVRLATELPACYTCAAGAFLPRVAGHHGGGAPRDQRTRDKPMDHQNQRTKDKPLDQGLGVCVGGGWWAGGGWVGGWVVRWVAGWMMGGNPGGKPGASGCSLDVPSWGPPCAPPGTSSLRLARRSVRPQSSPPATRARPAPFSPEWRGITHGIPPPGISWGILQGVPRGIPGASPMGSLPPKNTHTSESYKNNDHVADHPTMRNPFILGGLYTIGQKTGRRRNPLIFH